MVPSQEMIKYRLSQGNPIRKHCNKDYGSYFLKSFFFDTFSMMDEFLRMGGRLSEGGCHLETTADETSQMCLVNTSSRYYLETKFIDFG